MISSPQVRLLRDEDEADRAGQERGDGDALRTDGIRDPSAEDHPDAGADCDDSGQEQCGVQRVALGLHDRGEPCGDAEHEQERARHGEPEQDRHGTQPRAEQHSHAEPARLVGIHDGRHGQLHRAGEFLGQVAAAGADEVHRALREETEDEGDGDDGGDDARDEDPAVRQAGQERGAE